MIKIRVRLTGARTGLIPAKAGIHISGQWTFELPGRPRPITIWVYLKPLDYFAGIFMNIIQLYHILLIITEP